MRRRAVGVGVVLALLCLYGLFSLQQPPPSSAMEVPKRVAKPARRPVPAKRSTSVARTKAPRVSPESEPAEPSARTELLVDVVDEDGRPDDRARVWITGCKVLGGHQRAFEVAPGRCTVHGARRDGALYARSEPVDVEVVDGEAAYAQVQLASVRTGGLGVSVGFDNGAIRVLGVLPGTPAAEMGLVRGDRIVEVDGIPTDELGLRGFIRRMTGPEGTEVNFVLQYKEEGEVIEEPITIVRSYLES